MKTGTNVHKSWLYSSNCCQLEVLFNPGDTFSRCPSCSGLCDWEQMDVTTEELKASSTTRKLERVWARRSEPKLTLRHSF